MLAGQCSPIYMHLFANTKIITLRVFILAHRSKIWSFVRSSKHEWNCSSHVLLATDGETGHVCISYVSAFAFLYYPLFLSYFSSGQADVSHEMSRLPFCEKWMKWMSSPTNFAWRFKELNQMAPLITVFEITITKTLLFKYIENFSSKNWKFSDTKTPIFSTFLRF